jgi:polysaccharide biosynthesis transport protein
MTGHDRVIPESSFAIASPGVVAVASQIEMPDLENQDISTRTGLSVLQIMWQRKSLVVLGIMLGLVLGLLYYAQKQPTYQSAAQILVVKKSANDVDFGNRSDARMVVMDDYISTQQNIIKSYAILSKAIKMPQVKDLKTFTSESDFDRVYDIQQTLLVAPARDRDANSGMPSNILNLSFRGPVPEDCQAILEGIIASYRNFLDTG